MHFDEILYGPMKVVYILHPYQLSSIHRYSKKTLCSSNYFMLVVVIAFLLPLDWLFEYVNANMIHFYCTHMIADNMVTLGEPRNG